MADDITAADNPETPDLSPGPRARALLAVSALAAIAASIWYLVWAQMPLFIDVETRQQSQSGVAPRAAKFLAQQLSGSEPLAEWNLPIGPVALVLLWLVMTMSFGHAVLCRLMRSDLAGMEKAVFCFGVGLSASSVVILTAGCVGGASVAALSAICGVMLTIGLASTIPMLLQQRTHAPAIGSSERTPYGLLQRAAAFALCGFVLLLAVACLAPPMQSDAMRYHLGAPQEFLKLGMIRPLPLNAFSNFPFLLEMQYMLALAAKAPEASQLMHLCCALFTSLAIVCAARRLIGARGSAFAVWFPASAYLCMPASAISATWPNVDHATALFAILSGLACHAAAKNGTFREWLLAGLMIGGACATKYTMLANMAPLGLLALAIAVGRAQSYRMGALARSIMALALGFAFTGGPWFLKNAVMIRNPVYPLLNSWFHAGDWTPENQQLYMSQAGMRGVAKTVGNLLLSPYYATFQWFRFEEHNAAGVILILAGLAVSLPLALRARFACRGIALLLLFVSALGWTLWFFTYQSNRLLLPILATALPLVAIPLSLLPNVSRALYRSAIAVFCLVLCHGALWTIQWSYVTSDMETNATPIPYLTGQRSFTQYMTRWQNHWPAFDYVNRIARSDDGMMLIGDHKIFGAQPHAVWNDWFNTPAIADWIRTRDIQTSDQLLASLRDNKIRWIVIDEPEIALQGPKFIGRLSEHENGLLNALRNANEPTAARKEINRVTVLDLAPPATKR